MENTIGLLISIAILTLIGVVLIKQIKKEAWQWNGLNVGLSFLYLSLMTLLIYHLFINLF
jgi:membrane protein DedA with SNARE-associated domain